MNFLKRIFGLDRNFGSKRSPKWRKVRREHLKKHPRCAISGKKKGREVHHVQPFYLRPDLELDPTNLITLNKKYHLIFGHLGNYKRVNYQLRRDIKIWRQRILGSI